MSSARPILHVAPLLLKTLASAGLLLQAAAVQAQAPAITSDGTTRSTITQTGNAYDVSGGTTKGSNLFHSFGRFNVLTDGSATFTGPSSVTNIVSRVTGGDPSTIDGRIHSRTSMPNANFFLINPSGVVFGSGARLEVGGSFHVSTADYVGFGNDEPKFFAKPEEGPLSAAPPAAFGFLNPTPAPISVQGSRLPTTPPVNPGRTLSLVGGDVQIAGSVPVATTLSAPGGRIQIVSVGPPVPGQEGLVTLGPDVNLSSFARLGKIDISNRARIDTSGARGGTVLIRGGRLTVDNSSLLANTTGGLAGAAVGIDIKVEGDIVLLNPGSVLQGSVVTRAFSGGRAGNIEVEARNGDIRITGGASIGSDSFSFFTTGQAGNVTVKATDAVVLSGTSSKIFSFSAFPNVPAGEILVEARSVALMDRAQIESGRPGTQGGNVAVTAKDSIVIAGASEITSRAFSRDVGFVEISVPDGAVIMDNGFINTITRTVRNAGRISVNARDLILTHGSRINSSSELPATTGAGGSQTVTADSVTISGGSGLFSTAAEGPGGNIRVNANRLTLANQGTMSARSTGSGTAGNVELVIGDTLRMVGSEITTEALSAVGGNISIITTESMLHLTDSRIATSVQGGVGRGGDITMGSTSHPVEFILLNHSPVRADAFGGPGGNISIAASVFLAGESPVTASSALSVSGRIDIQADVTDVSGSLAQLPEAILQAAALLRAACAARLAGGKTSTLVVAGREGLPLEPGGLLPSPLMAEGPPGGGLSRSAEHQWERVAAERYRLVAPSAVLDRRCSR